MNLHSTSSSVSYLAPGSLEQSFVYHADSEKESTLMRRMRLKEPRLFSTVCLGRKSCKSMKHTKEDLPISKQITLFIPFPSSPVLESF